MKIHKDGTIPKNGAFFVFGSNLAGRHGAGAAKIALEKFGAIYGDPFGIQGNSYAIPTKDSKLIRLPLNDIYKFVDRFISVAKVYHDKEFFVTRIGCGLAGYKDSDIAPMFKAAPNNCSFAEEWREYL